MARKTKEKKEVKVKEKKEKKGVSQKVVVNVKVGETKRPKRTYTRRSTPTTSDGARPGPTGVYSYVPAGPPAPSFSIPQQQVPVLPEPFRPQPTSGLSLEDVRKVGREQAIGLLKEAEPAIRMAIEDISQKRANEAIMKSQGAEQRAELEKKFVVPVSKGPIALAKEKLPSISRIKGQPDMTPENFGVGYNELFQDPESKEQATQFSVGELKQEEPKVTTKLRGRPLGSKNRPKDIVQAEKEAKLQRKFKTSTS